MTKRNVRLLLFALAGALAIPSVALAATRYVSMKNTTPSSPYTTWGSAATNIQQALNTSQDGDVIIVSNGVYATSTTMSPCGCPTRVTITKGVTLRSANGPETTVIQGAGPNGSNAVRCVYMSHSNAVLTGFTVRNGHTPIIGDNMARSGGGIMCRQGTVQQCIIVSNLAHFSGGGIYGTAATRVRNSMIKDCFAEQGGGAYGTNSVIQSCTIINNGSVFTNSGGGVRYCIVENSILYFNTNYLDAAINNYVGGSFSYTCTQPLPAGTGNLAADPMLYANNHLHTASPCLNRGTNSAYTVGALDLAGNPRVLDGILDIGAYEVPHIVAVQQPNGLITPTGLTQVAYDSTINYVVAATSANYRITSVTTREGTTDIPYSGINVDTLTNTFTQVRHTNSITATYALDLHTFDVTSTYGTPQPPVGKTTNDYNTQITAVMQGSPITQSETQLVCIGWNGTGSTPANDGTVNTGPFALQTDSTISWLWMTNYRFTVSANADGNVTGDGTAWYARGNGVNVTAVPNDHYHFIGWTGTLPPALQMVNPLGLTMTQSWTVAANFEIDRHTLSASSAYGSPNPVGIITQDYGTALSPTVDASIDLGTTQYLNTGWTMTISPHNGTTNSFNMILTNNAVLTWLWRTNYQFTVNAGPNGSVTGANSGLYIRDSVVNVTAVQDEHYNFLGWTGDVPPGQTTNHNLTLTMDQPRSITANFAINQHSLTVFSAYGTPNPSGINPYPYGTNLLPTLSGSPVIQDTTQYVCLGWSMPQHMPYNGTTTNFSMTFTNDATLTWLWRTNYFFTRTAGANGQITGATNGWYTNGHVLQITAIPETNYFFWQWTGDVPAPIATNSTIDLTMDRVRGVTALFSLVRHELTVVTPYGTANPTGVTEIENSNVVTCTVGPSPLTVGATQYVCRGWTGTGNAPASGSTTNTGPFAILTASSINWLWTTNVQFTVTSDTGGSTTGNGSGFYALGTNITVNAVANPHFVFTHWTGDVSSGQESNLTLNITMDRAKSVMAQFDGETHTLTVNSFYGTPSPSGVTTAEYNTAFTPSLAGSPVVAGTTQYVCTGWSMDNDPMTGSTTNFSMSLTNDTVLTWLWTTNYYIDFESDVFGVVNRSDGWYPAGTSIMVTAQANTGYAFDYWTNSLVTGTQTNNPVTVTNNAAFLIKAFYQTNLVLDSMNIEPFTYTPGPLNGNGTTTNGFTGAWSQDLVGRFGDVIIPSTQLMYNYQAPSTAIRIQGGNRAAQSGEDPGVIYRLLDTPLTTASNHYMSCLVRFEQSPRMSSNHYTLGFGISQTNIASTGFEVPALHATNHDGSGGEIGFSMAGSGIGSEVDNWVAFSGSKSLRLHGQNNHTITFDSVDCSSYGWVGFSMQLYIRSDNYEADDQITIFLRLTNAPNIMLLDVSDLDELPESRWFPLSAAIPPVADSAQLIIQVNRVNQNPENAYVDAIQFNPLDTLLGGVTLSSQTNTYEIYAQGPSGNLSVPYTAQTGISYLLVCKLESDQVGEFTNICVFVNPTNHALELAEAQLNVAASITNNPDTLYWEHTMYSTLTNLLITEVYYDSPQNVPDDVYEWIELYNPTPNPIALTNYLLTDVIAGGTDNERLSGLIRPNWHHIIAANNDFHVNFVLTNASISYLTRGEIGNGLNEFSDGVVLMDGASNMVDGMSYLLATNILDPSVTNALAGESLERFPSDRDTDSNADWQPQENPSPGRGSVPQAYVQLDEIRFGTSWKAVLPTPWFQLQVVSPYDTPQPAVGYHIFPGYSMITAQMTQPFVTNMGGTTQYVCNAWTSAGFNVNSGLGTSTNLTIVQSNAVLTWLWTTNVRFEAKPTADMQGATNGWYALGSQVTVTNIAPTSYTFLSWTGDVPLSAVSSNPLTLNLDRARFIRALYNILVITNGPVPVPEWWLSRYFTNNFQAAVTNDNDGDSYYTWEEWIALTDPTNDASYLRITQVAASNAMAQDITCVLVDPSTNSRNYRLYSSTNLALPVPWVLSVMKPGNDDVLKLCVTNSPFPLYLRLTVQAP